MLAPSVERAAGPAHDFAIAARDRYPDYVAFLAERTGVTVPLNRLGILQVALSARGIKGLQKAALPTSSWLHAKELTELEPALADARGAMFNPDDGAVDNTVLLAALQKFSAAAKLITLADDSVIEIEPNKSTTAVRTASGNIHDAARVVLAAGAWAGRISGARFARVVQPARGQLVSYPMAPLRHIAYGPRGYIVPRGSATIGGSTMEDVGFDANTTADGIAKVRSAAQEICPALTSAADVRAWAGLRPVTPDMLPLIGIDPEYPSLVYACGHSRNGVLMAPLTGDVIADLVTATPLSHDLSQFRPDRF
jgi:glycine oxidase